MISLSRIFRAGSEVTLLLLLLLFTASVYGDTAEPVKEHENIVVLDVENMT